MDLGLKGRVALVLASSKGMGLASAMALAAEGMDVAMCARGEAGLRRAAAAVKKRSRRRVLWKALDVEERANAVDFTGEVVRTLGGLDVLVTNCGGPPPGAPDEISDEQWDRAAKSTLRVAIDWTRAAVPVMKRRRWGRILHITSLAVKQPIDNLILSNTMRAGVAGFAKTMARDLAPHGITVNTLCPGLVLTDRLRSLAALRARAWGVSAAEAMKRMTAEIPAGRIGTPEEFAAVVAFLAGEPASYVTGATLQVDGGACRGLL